MKLNFGKYSISSCPMRVWFYLILSHKHVACPDSVRHVIVTKLCYLSSHSNILSHEWECNVRTLAVVKMMNEWCYSYGGIEHYIHGHSGLRKIHSAVAYAVTESLILSYSISLNLDFISSWFHVCPGSVSSHKIMIQFYPILISCQVLGQDLLSHGILVSSHPISQRSGPILVPSHGMGDPVLTPSQNKMGWYRISWSQQSTYLFIDFINFLKNYYLI